MRMHYRFCCIMNGGFDKKRTFIPVKYLVFEMYRRLRCIVALYGGVFMRKKFMVPIFDYCYLLRFLSACSEISALQVDVMAKMKSVIAYVLSL
jgi:hypothetical protein